LNILIYLEKLMLTRTTQENTDIDENKAQHGQPANDAAQNRPSPNGTRSNDPNVSAISGAAKTPGKTRAILATIVRAIIQIILMIAILFASYMAMNRLIASKPEIRKRPSFRTVYTVQTVPVVLGDHRPNFTVYGEAAASRSVDLRSLVSGEVISINSELKAGARVNKGDALVEIDRFNFEGALREARANRDEVLARIRENESLVTLEISKIQRLDEQLELARSDHKRIADLRSNGTTTQKQLDDRTMVLSQRAQLVEQSQINLQTEKAKLEQQKASLARLDWRVQLAERNLLNTILKAPFDGIVRSTGVEIGKTVSANDVVVSLYEDANMDIRFTLTDERYGRLQADQSGLVGREIEIIWAIGGRDHSYPATIERVGAVISSSRGGMISTSAIVSPSAATWRSTFILSAC
jgi:multidrug efflux pump subunit AcrA (membrane-fusion protein)